MAEKANTPEEAAVSVPAQPVAVQIPQPAVNPLLDRIVLPGQTFRLPSGGLFYTTGELSSDVVDGEVHVHPMTAIDEIMIKTPDLLFSGKAIREVFNRCIPQILNPTMLLAKDVDFMLICLRQVTYGDRLDLEAVHTCDDAKKHGYQVSISKLIKSAKEIDPSKLAKYTVEFNNGQVAHLRPVRFTDYVQLMQTTAQVEKDRAEDDGDYIVEQAKTIMFDSLSSVIVSVDDVTDRDHIRGWLESISAGWIKQITIQITELAEWGPVFSSIVNCKDCGEEFTITAPLNPVAFFT